MRNTKVLDDDEELKRIFRFSRPLQRRAIVTPSSDAKVHETGDNGRRRDSETAAERDSCRGQRGRAQHTLGKEEGQGERGEARQAEKGRITRESAVDRQRERESSTQRRRKKRRDRFELETETDSKTQQRQNQGSLPFDGQRERPGAPGDPVLRLRPRPPGELVEGQLDQD